MFNFKIKEGQRSLSLSPWWLCCQQNVFFWLMRQCGPFHLWWKRVKRFVNVYLHCIVSDVKWIRKMATLPPLEKFLRTHMATQIFVKKPENLFVSSINEPSKFVAEFANVCKHLLYMQWNQILAKSCEYQKHKNFEILFTAF